MLIPDMKKVGIEAGQDRLRDCGKLAATLGFRRKVDKAIMALNRFFERTKNPAISCGGGKDSTAVAILSRKINPDCLLICGDPPNPLMDREKHLENLFSWLGGNIKRVSYAWNVKAVLSGEEKYPDGLKMRVLRAWHKTHNIDGIVLGIRQTESRSRKLILRSKGLVYQTQTGMRCCPIGDFTAQEVLALALLYDAPINPVYTKQKGNTNFEYIRDGTWWPHGFVDQSSWIREYYPDHYEDYRRATLVYDCHKSRVCEY